MTDDAMLPQPRVPDALYDVDAERGVLGSILLDGTTLARVVPLLQAEDFYRERHRRIYRAMLRLLAQGTEVDTLTVRGALGDTTDDGQDWASLLAELMLATPTHVHALGYARIVQQFGLRRRILHAARLVGEAAYEFPGDAEAAIRAALGAVGALASHEGGREFVGLDTALSTYYDRLAVLAQHGPTGSGPGLGLPTGLTDLDRLCGGLQRGDLIVLAARPGHGKSALAMQVATASARAQACVAIASLEMSTDSLAHRLVSGTAGVDSVRLRTGVVHQEEWHPLSAAIGQLAALPIWICDAPALSVLELRARLQTLRRGLGERSLGLLIVDYVQLMAGTAKRGETRAQEVGEIARGLKALARELDVPLLACAQLNRAIDSRPGHRPQLSDLRESGDLEANADLVWFLVRDEVYEPGSPRAGIADLYVAKHRNGPLADLELRFDARTTTFQDFSPREAR